MRPAPVGHDHAHALVGPEDGGRHDLCTEHRQIEQGRRVPVHHELHAFRDPETRRAARSRGIEPFLGWRFDDGNRGFALVSGRRRRHHRRADVLAVVCDDPHLAGGELGVGLDAVDERASPRGGGEEALQYHDLRTVPRDGLERTQGLAVVERLRVGRNPAVR